MIEPTIVCPADGRAFGSFARVMASPTTCRTKVVRVNHHATANGKRHSLLIMVSDTSVADQKVTALAHPDGSAMTRNELSSKLCHFRSTKGVRAQVCAHLCIQAGAQDGLQRLGCGKADAFLLRRQEAGQDGNALRKPQRRLVGVQLVQPVIVMVISDHVKVPVAEGRSCAGVTTINCTGYGTAQLPRASHRISGIIKKLRI